MYGGIALPLTLSHVFSGIFISTKLQKKWKKQKSRFIARPQCLEVPFCKPRYQEESWESKVQNSPFCYFWVQHWITVCLTQHSYDILQDNFFCSHTYKAAQCNVVTFNLGVSCGDKAPTEDLTAWEGQKRGGHFAEYWNLLWVLVDWTPPPEDSILHFCYEIWEWYC